MQVPLTVSFKEVPVSESIRTACWNEAEKLERYYDRITSCHVTISQPKRRRTGNHFDIHVRLVVPGSEIVVSRSPLEHMSDEKPLLAIREAFDEVRRQLQDHVRRRRGDTKHHEPAPGAAPGVAAEGLAPGARGATPAAPAPAEDWGAEPE